MVDDLKYQVMPDLTTEEYSELKADIAQRGVMVPIEFDEDGNVLDGHHRLRACEELGIKDYPKVIRAGMSEPEKMTHARKLNMARRHLTQEQRNDIYRAQLLETPTASNRQIARDIGGSPTTVGAIRKEMEAAGKIKSVDERIREAIAEAPEKSNLQIAKEIGVSDKTVGARRRETERTNSEFVQFGQIPKSEEPRKPVTVFNPTAREQRALRDERVVERMKETGSSNPVGVKQKLQSEDKAERKSYELAKEIPDGAMRLFVGDIRTGLPEIEDDSIDFIITDPPYPKEYLLLYQDLALLSQRVLKPGGSLIVMSGQSYLPEIYAVLSSALDYYWTCAYMTPGAGAPHLWQKRVSTFWKPLLWFTKGVYQGEFIGDVFTSPVDELDKSYHEWGQTVGGMKDIVEKFTNPGDVILDPYLGGGATGVAAIMQGRKFIGVDIEEDCVRRSRERIEQVYGQN